MEKARWKSSVKDQGIWIKCGYDPVWLQNLKGQIPARQRYWDADRKMWWVGNPYRDLALGITRNAFRQCTVHPHMFIPDYEPFSDESQGRARNGRHYSKPKFDEPFVDEGLEDLFDDDLDGDGGFEFGLGDDISGKDERRREKILDESSSISDAYQELFLLQNAPKEVVKAAYKALVALNHPDSSGGNDPEKTKRLQVINMAYRKILRHKMW